MIAYPVVETNGTSYFALYRVRPDANQSTNLVELKFTTVDIRTAGIKRLAPQAVYDTATGLDLQYKLQFTEEWGLFIARKQSNFVPEEGGDPSYTIITNRVYFYHISG